MYVALKDRYFKIPNTNIFQSHISSCYADKSYINNGSILYSHVTADITILLDIKVVLRQQVLNCNYFREYMT